MAMRNYPEFLGYKPRRFPHKPHPKPVEYSERRLDLPAGFQEDWRKIKTKQIFQVPEIIIHEDYDYLPKVCI